MIVTAASSLAPLSHEPARPFSLAAGETATIPSPGGTLRLLVQRDAPDWRFTSIVPSVASVTNAAGIPYVSDFSVSNMQSVETVVGLELWTAAGRRESSLIRLPAYGSKTMRDVVKSAFGLEQTFGSLLVYSTGYVTSGARTWAPVSGGGTNGQFALAGDVRNPSSAAVLLMGETGVLTGVRQDSGFRTNVGVYNLTDKDCVVEVEARNDEGQRVGSQLVLDGPPDPLRAAVARRRHREQPPVGLRPPGQHHVGVRRRKRRLRDRQRHAGPVRRLAAQEALSRPVPEGRP